MIDFFYIAGCQTDLVSIGGITGTFETLDTSDANATPEDIIWGETAYVDGQKITGTATRPLKVETSYTTDSITIKVNSDDFFYKKKQSLSVMPDGKRT